MIEVVYNANENKKKNENIRIPKNIKQVGDMGRNRKIYVEDYVISHIEEAHRENNQDVVGVLMGNVKYQDNDNYTFIKGAITIPNIFISESEIEITESNWTYIYDIASRYFPDLEIVGWFVSLYETNITVNKTLRKVHMNQFGSGEKVLYVLERQTKNRYFMAYNDGILEKQPGYVIFYEKNQQMQDYMVDMKNGKRIEINEPNHAFEVNEHKNMQAESSSPKEMPVKVKKEDRFVSTINYIANTAMIILVLFVGIYVVNQRSESQNINVLTNETESSATVVKVDGNVFPTQAENIEETASELETIAATESNNLVENETKAEQATNEEGGKSYIVVNNNIETVGETSKESTAANTDKPVVSENVTKVSYTEHVVKKGENLITICKNYYGDTKRVEEVMELNKIDDMDKIYEGEIIKLP